MLDSARRARLARLAPFFVVALLSGCGGGCGNCTVPAFNAAPAPGATPTPLRTPLPPGVTPSPTPTPLPSGVTPTPTPIPTPIVTPTPTPTPPPPPPLACAASNVLGPNLAPFAVLAGSQVTNVGNTLVTYAPGAISGTFHDDLVGNSPSSPVLGFSPNGLGNVTDGPTAIYGSNYNTNGAVTLAAQNARTTAYNTLAGRAANYTLTGAGDLSTFTVPGGAAPGTLPPGVYNSAGTLAISAGNLTLDGQNNPQSVFVFQAGSSLTTVLNGPTSGNVILINGANACNIYWAVFSSATLGGATFSGNVLAGASITLNATMFTGRALAGAAVSIPVVTGSLITNPGGQ